MDDSFGRPPPFTTHEVEEVRVLARDIHMLQDSLAALVRRLDTERASLQHIEGAFGNKERIEIMFGRRRTRHIRRRR